MIFKLLVILSGLISSIFYAYFAAFRHDVDYIQYDKMNVRKKSVYFTDEDIQVFVAKYPHVSQSNYKIAILTPFLIINQITSKSK